MAWLAAVYLKHLCGFYLTRGYLSANSIVNRPCPNRRFILCHRAADQSNRIKNNEIARISLTKYTYTYIYIYISPHLHFVNLRQPVHRVSRLLFFFFPPLFVWIELDDKAGRWVSRIKSDGKKKKNKHRQCGIREVKLSINLCIKKLIFTLYVSRAKVVQKSLREDSD